MDLIAKMIDRIFWHIDRKKVFKDSYFFLVSIGYDEAYFSWELIKASSVEAWAENKTYSYMKEWDEKYPPPPWYKISFYNFLYCFINLLTVSFVIFFISMFFWLIAGHPGCFLGTGAHCDPPKFFWRSQ